MLCSSSPAGRVAISARAGNSPAASPQAAPPAPPPSQVAAFPAAHNLHAHPGAPRPGHCLFAHHFISSISSEQLISIGIYLLLWRARIAVIFRDWARRVSPRLFVQCLIFVPLFLVAATLLNFPLDFYSGYLLEHRFGLSTQGVASWFGDWGKSLAYCRSVGRGGCVDFLLRSSAAAPAVGGSTFGWLRFPSSWPSCSSSLTSSSLCSTSSPLSPKLNPS